MYLSIVSMNIDIIIVIKVLDILNDFTTSCLVNSGFVRCSHIFIMFSLTNGINFLLLLNNIVYTGNIVSILQAI